MWNTEQRYVAGGHGLGFITAPLGSMYVKIADRMRCVNEILQVLQVFGLCFFVKIEA